jgi:hypothetical protein
MQQHTSLETLQQLLHKEVRPYYPPELPDLQLQALQAGLVTSEQIAQRQAHIDQCSCDALNALLGQGSLRVASHMRFVGMHVTNEYLQWTYELRLLLQLPASRSEHLQQLQQQQQQYQQQHLQSAALAQQQQHEQQPAANPPEVQHPLQSAALALRQLCPSKQLQQLGNAAKRQQQLQHQLPASTPHTTR